MSSSEVKSTIIADQTGEKSKESEGTKHLLSNDKDVVLDVVATPDAVTTAQPVDNCEWQEDAMEVDDSAESLFKSVQTEAACVSSPNNNLALETTDHSEDNNVDMEDEHKGHTETSAHPVNTGQEDSFNRGDHTPDTKGEDTVSTSNNIPADQILTEKSNNNKPAQATVDCNNQEGLASFQTTKEVGSISHNIGGTDQDSSTGDSTSGAAAKSTIEQATDKAGDQISAPAETSANTIYRGVPEPTAQVPESSGPTVPDTNLNPLPDKSKVADSSGLGDSYSNTVPGLTGGKNPSETVIEKASADQIPDSQNSVVAESDTDDLGDSSVSSTLDSNLKDNKNIDKPDSYSSNNLGDISDSAKPDSLKTDQAKSVDNQNSTSFDVHNRNANKLEELSEGKREKLDLSTEDKSKETDTMGGCISSNNSADEEDPNSSNKKNKKSTSYGSIDNQNSKKQIKKLKPYRPGDRDTENYRNGYPDLEEDKHAKANWLFYSNKIKSEPDGDLIDDIHQYWKRDYKKLERHHGYIQWLFPIREHGMNYRAQPLQLHEAEKIRNDSKAKARVLESYRLMLDFYGMELVDERTGELQRSENWEACYDNLCRNSHNYLRITRILKSLGELGYEHLKKPFLEFVLKEALVEKELTPTLSSCENYWIGTVKNDDEREELYQLIEKYKNK